MKKARGIFNIVPTKEAKTAAPAPEGKEDNKLLVAVPLTITVAGRAQLRITAAEKDMTQLSILREALNDWFTKIGKPPIA
jgi:hypothetical protein